MNKLNLLALSMQTVHIFDLDGTTIDSFERVEPCLREGGDLDLDKYRKEACVHNKVMRDKLMPLAEYMKALIAKGEIVVICTARHMANSDYYYLRKNGLRVPLVLSRDQLHKHFTAEQVQRIYNSGDAAYKGAYFDMLLERFGTNHEFIMYDDHQGVLKAAKARGFTAIDATNLNLMLEIAYQQGFNDMEELAYNESESLIESLTGQLLGASA